MRKPFKELVHDVAAERTAIRLTMRVHTTSDFRDELALAFREGAKYGAVWGMNKAASLCKYEYESMAFMRNEAAKEQARGIEICCLATAGRIERDEYENPTSSVMENAPTEQEKPNG